MHAYSGESVTLPVAAAMAVSAVPAVNLAMSVHLLVALGDALADVLDPRDQGPVKVVSRECW